MDTINITPAQLRKAANIQEKILELQRELGQLLGGEVSTPAQPTGAPKKKRKMTPAWRAALARAWAARRAKAHAAEKSKS